MGRLLKAQDGVISRGQALTLGLRPHDLERLVRRRIWARVVPGVFVDHTGPPSWPQQAWAGVLHFGPAALAGSSAVRAVNGPGWPGWRPGSAIEVAVAAQRRVSPLEGYRVVRTRDFDHRVQWNCRPPRIRYEEAVIDMAAEAPSDLAATAVLADACGSRRTTAQRLLTGIAGRRRIRRRDWLIGVLNDVAEGTCSVLEHAHLTRVERAHGLPRGRRQAPETVGGRRMFRDVDYPDQRLVVELDGRLFHDSTGQRELDLERDLDAAVDGRESIRLGWGQCTDRACSTAEKLAVVLRARGWSGLPTRCGPDCSA